MSAFGPWIRSEWRIGARSLVSLTLIIAFGGAITIAAAAGARRADSAFDRMLAIEAAPIELTIDPRGDPDELDLMWDELPAELAAIPGVLGVRPVAWTGVALQADGVPLSFFSAILGDPIGDDPPAENVLRGRAAITAREAVINEGAAQRIGADIGDVIQLRSFSSDQVDAFLFNDAIPDQGPIVEVEVVGISRGSEDIAYNPDEIAFFSGEFRTTYNDEIAICDCSIDINAAPHDVERVIAALPDVIGDAPLTVGQYDLQSAATIRHAVSLEVGALWIGTAVAVIATLVAIVQMSARYIGSRRSTMRSLSALGATRPELVRGWVLVVAPALAAGVVMAGGGAILLSSLFPRGLARRAEPSPGIRVDTTAITVGGGALALAIVGVTVAIASRTARMATSGRPTPAMSRLAWWPTPPAALGTTLAVDPAGDRSRLAVMTAVFGLALGVAGILAVDLVEGSTSEVLSTPAAFAADWDLEITESPEDPDAVMEATMAEPIDAFAFKQAVGGNDTFEMTGPGGSALIQPLALTDVIGSTGPFIERGSPARTSNDAVIGRLLATALGADVGDEIRFEPGGARFEVTGIGRISDDDNTNDSAVVTIDGLMRLTDGHEPSLTGAYVRLGEGDDDVRDRLSALGWQEPVPPSRIANLGRIGSVPSLLAAALAALGLAGLLHALLLAVGRRGGDIAIARALGFTPRQARASIAWQGITTTAAGIAIGVPLGLLAGRIIWKRIATGVGALDVVSVPWSSLAAVPVGALVVVAALGVVIGTRAARLRPAEALRSE